MCVCGFSGNLVVVLGLVSNRNQRKPCYIGGSCSIWRRPYPPNITFFKKANLKQVCVWGLSDRWQRSYAMRWFLATHPRIAFVFSACHETVWGTHVKGRLKGCKFNIIPSHTYQLVQDSFFAFRVFRVLAVNTIKMLNMLPAKTTQPVCIMSTDKISCNLQLCVARNHIICLLIWDLASRHLAMTAPLLSVPAKSATVKMPILR